MTQILAHRSKMGILIATDSRGVPFSRDGGNGPHYVEVSKLFPLSPNAIAVTGGAGYGVLLCQSFQKYVREGRLQEYEDVVDCALPFFSAQLERVRRYHSAPERPDLDRLYILLAGSMPQASADPFRFVLLTSEGPSDPLREAPTENVVAIPRQIGIEHRLSRLTPSDNLLEKVEGILKDFLRKLAASDDEVGPPFDFVRLTSNGMEMMSFET